jgi:hypothetical protein
MADARASLCTMKPLRISWALMCTLWPLGIEAVVRAHTLHCIYNAFLRSNAQVSNPKVESVLHTIDKILRVQTLLL